MTTREFFEAIGSLSGLLFIISSMLAMGMSLTMAQILQPLKNVRLVLMALLANFVLVPLLAYIIILVIPLEQSLQIGLIVLATAAGAPFLPKLVQGAKGNVAFGVGLMVLRPQCDGCGYCAVQRGGRNSGKRAELLRHRHSVVCFGGRRAAVADPAADSEAHRARI